jgi:molybdate transport system substrate-binding protein
VHIHRLGSVFFGILWIGLSYAQAAEVRIFAAASLTEAITAVGQAYEKQHPETTLTYAFAGSATLAKQITRGARADIFISADTDWANYLTTQNLLAANTRVNLLSNTLVLIYPSGKPLPSLSFTPQFNLAKHITGKICLGDPNAVPAGKYAKQAFTYYGWWDNITSRVVGTEDVRSALTFVERGECDLGVVYATDAKLSRKVVTWGTFPAESHAPITYPGGLLKQAKPEAKRVWDFMNSNAAQAIFQQHGFLMPNT